MRPDQRQIRISLMISGTMVTTVILVLATFRSRENAPETKGPTVAIQTPAAVFSGAPGGSSGVAGFPVMRATSPEEVREVVRHTRQAKEEDIPALLEAALLSEDPLVAGNAIRALGRLKAVSQDTRLVALLKDPRKRVRQEIVVALGRSQDQRMVDTLLPFLSDEDETLRTLALQALGRLGGRKARDAIRSVIDNEKASTIARAFARSALAAPRGGAGL